jgi:hypothetical protein
MDLPIKPTQVWALRCWEIARFVTIEIVAVTIAAGEWKATFGRQIQVPIALATFGGASVHQTFYNGTGL